MKKLLLTLLLAASFTASAATIPTEIKFEKGNFFAITQQFDGNLLDNFSEKVLNYDGDKMYIYFDTPGGSVIALSRMARIMKSSNIEFTCVANFAASAGFMLFQHCDNRILLSDGILMSHNWAGGFQGEAPRIITLFSAIQSLVDTLEAVAVKKMNVDKKEYARLINNNLWMPSALATKYDAIDGVMDNVTCSKELLSKKVPTIISTYWSSTLVYKSGCPLIQKTYTKSSKNDTDEYVPTGKSLFELAQKAYKPEMGNMIYMGSK